MLKLDFVYLYMEISTLQPQEVWENFAALNAIPRASKKEEKVIRFLKEFGEKLNLETSIDSVGNVVIKKPATPGREGHKTVVLQSHIDMVHQKNADTDFDFDKDGIQMFVEEGWVKAKGTTLGADNGLGVAAIMAVLASKDLSHPRVEALFTVDEETGMTGALGLDSNLLKGEILLNLDTEEDDEITIGCAGGVDVTASNQYETFEVNEEGIEIVVKGLQGGHSGTDIEKGLANANVILSRILSEGFDDNLRLVEIDAGGLRNAIPREARALIVIDNAEEFLRKAEAASEDIKAEFAQLEKDLRIDLRSKKITGKAISAEDSKSLVQVIKGIPNGVFRMSPNVEGLVEASNNLARVSLTQGDLQILCLTRSSVESTKKELAEKIISIGELANMTVTLSGDYPGWKPNPDSEVVVLLDTIYKDMFGESAHISAVHAGLECGIIGGKFPGMEMISFGPTIRGAHSPDERANIKSVQKFWKFFKEILKEIK